MTTYGDIDQVGSYLYMYIADWSYLCFLQIILQTTLCSVFDQE